jgi:hypothetical protein
MDAGRPKRALRVVGDESEFQSWSWFCGHCAEPPHGGTPSAAGRVCESCGLGLLLQAPSDAAPRPDDAFLLVDSSLTVQAMSKSAERLLAISEDDAVNRHVTELVLPADAEGDSARPAGLAAAITRAAGGQAEASIVFVRPGMTFGVRLRALIAACGPPRAALVVFR